MAQGQSGKKIDQVKVSVGPNSESAFGELYAQKSAIADDNLKGTTRVSLLR